MLGLRESVFVFYKSCRVKLPLPCPLPCPQCVLNVCLDSPPQSQLTLSGLVQGNTSNAKDSDTSPFEVARMLLSLETERLPLGKKMDLVFEDADLVPLLIQENYVNHRPAVATNDDIRMKVCSDVFLCLS